MAMLAESVDAVIGVDTHTDTHTACLIDNAGREIATVTVEATPRSAAASSATPPDNCSGSWNPAPEVLTDHRSVNRSRTACPL